VQGRQAQGACVPRRARALLGNDETEGQGEAPPRGSRRPCRASAVCTDRLAALRRVRRDVAAGRAASRGLGRAGTAGLARRAAGSVGTASGPLDGGPLAALAQSAWLKNRSSSQCATSLPSFSPWTTELR